MRITSVLGALALFVLPIHLAGADVVIAKNGLSEYRIVVPDSATSGAGYAAAELQHFLQAISGAKLEIVAERQAGSGPAFLLGPGRRVDKTGLLAEAKKLTGDGVLIRTVGRDVVLLGDGDRGLLNSVYVLLERFLGCRFLAYDCTVAPNRRVLTLPQIAYSYSPPFIYREVLSFDASRWDFAFRQKLNGGNMGQLMALPSPWPGERVPGVVIYLFVHTFAAIVPPEKYLESHPEYFGLVKGKRQGGTIGGQLCLTNPEVLRMAKEKALEWIGQHPELMTVDISQNDAYPGSSGACECDKCAAIVREEGSQQGPILRFVNEVADAVNQKYPGKFVDTLAYDYTIIPPRITKPRDNVIVRLCHYGCYFHGVETEDMSKDFRTAVDRWPRLAKHVWIWHYGTNFWHYLAPNPNLESLVKDFRYYASRGIDGLMLQADIQSPGGELAELRQYLASQLMWDPSLDPMTVRSDFCMGYYGPAAAEAMEYLGLMDRLKDTNGKHYPTNGWDPAEVATPEFVTSGLAILTRGLAKAGDPVHRGRVEKLMLPLWYMQLGWPDRCGLTKEQGRALLVKFKNVVKAFKITNESEGPVGDMSRFLADMDAKYGAQAPGPVLGRSNKNFLREQARRIVDSARLPSGKSSGRWRNSTPYDIHVPGGNMGYPAYWVRDSVMMLGGELISAKEVEGWIRLMAGTLKGPNDWQVRPGVVVPAYAVPDHINFDGKATFYPGNYETGEKQGGEPWGKYPPLDDNFYFIAAVFEHWRMTGSLRLFNSRLKTSFSEETLAALCEKIYRVPPADAATGLVVAGDIKTENAKDWGFCDAEFKSGTLLFPSVLKYTAASQMARLFEASGDHKKALAYAADAGRIKGAIPPAFFHVSRDGTEGWLHSATGVGDQPDVWGSAFAVYSGAVDVTTTQKIAKALVRAFREKTAVQEGCVRQILTTDPVNGGAWENSIAKPGEYQNGGYWGTAAGWYIAAMAAVDRAAASDMAADYIGFLRNHLRPDGTAEAWEWFDPATGGNSNPLYAATVALPYISLRRAGLLTGRQ